MFRIAFLLAVAISMAVPVSAGATDFKTPEDAVTAYMTAVAAHDFDGVLATVALDEMSAKYDFEFGVEWLHSISWLTPMPATDPLYVALNRAHFTDQIGGELRVFTLALLSKNQAIADAQAAPMDSAAGAKFVQEVDAKRLGGISLVRIAVPNVPTNPGYSSILASRARVFGSDELAERIALFRFEGATYYVGFTLARYGEVWKVFNQSCQGCEAAKDFNIHGAPNPITPEAFDALAETP